ncbi:MAG TPA: class I SAM-dependent methyltransferase [Pyrinomonadaceae bacterium]|jgi:ubiquinone/menaquinone biosynthesis C-methylase UbiE|nr:class I SAM-dependent methyltransferase [Pyrinomonadaceae bacterium]
MTENASEVLAAWETSSQYWNKHQALIEQMYTPLSRALIEEARIVSGQAVLDVGGGSGEPSLTIAPVVGDSGSVTYTDPAAGMVKAAQEEAARRGVRNLQFQQCPAERLPFADETFDVAVGRMSAMFFPDVVAGLREILRVVKPGGRVSFLVWSSREANPFFSVVTEILDRFVPAEVEDEDAPTAFRFAAPGKLAKLLEEAGAISVTERAFDFSIEAPITVEQFWELRTEMSDTFRKKLARLVPIQVEAIQHTVQKKVRNYFKTGGMVFPGQVLLVTGQKP